MKCNCKWTETILGLVIPSCCVLVIPGIFSAMVNKWILVVVTVLLVLHAFGCKSLVGLVDMKKGLRKKEDRTYFNF